MKRRIAAALIATIGLTTPVLAAEGDPRSTSAVSTAAAAAAAAAPLAADVDWSMSPVRMNPGARESRGAALPSLYVSLASLNAFDAFSTSKALTSGAGAETNPLIGGAAGNSAAMWAVKGAVTAGTIFAAERLWKDHKRGQAIAVMLVSNGVMAAVATQNARVINGR